LLVTTWVLERDVFPDGHEALASAVLIAGARVVSWQDGWWSDGRWPRPAEPVVFHGSLGNADRIGRELPWSPGAFCSTNHFACSEWWPRSAEYLVTPRYALTTVADLVDSGPPEEFGERVFVRPDSPLKPFSGRILRRDQITLRALDHGFYYDDDALPVVVAPEIAIGDEWRFVVVAGTVIAGSDYTPQGRTAGAALSPDHPAWGYAADLVSKVEAPDPVFVLDVCESDTGLHLLEFNPFSGADLYDATGTPSSTQCMPSSSSTRLSSARSSGRDRTDRGKSGRFLATRAGLVQGYSYLSTAMISSAIRAES
jgi:hypothetical protein